MTNQPHRPFLALLKLEVLRNSTIYGNPLALILWAVLMGCSVAPALLLLLNPENPIHSASLLLQEGWASMMVVTLIASGFILVSLGVVAEYVGAAVTMAMGRPLYVIVRDREEGPLGREAAASVAPDEEPSR